MAEQYTLEEQLEDVNKAIAAIMAGGQSYRLGTRSITRADLKMLIDLRRDLEAQAVNQSANLLDNTFLAVFEGR